MDARESAVCTAFEGFRRIASGAPAVVAARVKEVCDRPGHDPVLVFDDATGESIELDLRGTIAEVVERLTVPAEPPRGPGRPRLGVVAREVTLLPRHWEWLGDQPGGASVALRKLVDDARREHEGRDRVRHAQETAYRFLSALAGNLPAFEEVTRALFAGDRTPFEALMERWPDDVGSQARKLADGAFRDAYGS